MNTYSHRIQISILIQLVNRTAQRTNLLQLIFILCILLYAMICDTLAVNTTNISIQYAKNNTEFHIVKTREFF
jgi:hypothetical protein